MKAPPARARLRLHRLEDDVVLAAKPNGAPQRAQGDAKGSPWDDISPLREALFSVERLEEHARNLAREHTIAARPASRPSLARRIGANARVLSEAYQTLSAAAGAGETIAPAGEWILDNYHVVERQIRDIRTDLPPGYYKTLPKLGSGFLQGYPRVLGATWAYVAHTDSHFDPDILCRFLCAYQTTAPLMIGELWAVPITLRVLLVENLRRFAEVTLRAREARIRANALADRLIIDAARGADTLKASLAALGDAALSNAFTDQLAQRLRDQDPSVAPALAWLEQRLAFEKTSIDEVVGAEQQREINATITVRNIITSMRLANDVDWRDLVERMSLVDGVLANSTAFARMDFPTRDLYRRAIEDIARGAGRSELDIARSAAAAAAQAPPAEIQDNPRIADPGHYLIGAGRPWFEKALDYSAPPLSWPARAAKALGIGGYVAAGVSTSLALLGLGLWVMASFGLDWRWLTLLGVVGAVPAAEAAVAIVNNALTRGLVATSLPAMELPEGVPNELRTLVVAPILLTSQEAIAELIQRLEVHYLSSPKGEVYFALLSDWTDANAPHTDTDDALVHRAAQGIAQLNEKYGPARAGARFLLLHRKRVWTPSEGKWIGWERKRGKLSELNELLRSGRPTTFVAVDGAAPRAPEGVRYVITLDADTRLTAEAVRRLIGKMAHPLNAPRLDPLKRRVVDGYGILQPRVTPSMPVGCDATPFLRIFSNMSGIDPYAAAASDVYQDLLGEGSYTGKGIYDVDAFRAALCDRVPASSLLSHDLFEGDFARAALVSDIEFVEEFPDRYDAAALRHHRWARGDWQLLPWIIGPARDLRGKPVAVTAVGRWKMIDNLRRSFAAPAATLALLAGLALSTQASLAWIGFILALLAAAPLMPVLALLAPRWGHGGRRDLRAVAANIRLALAQWLLSSALLAHQGWLMADAAGRTLLRLVSRKKLLEWTPAAQARFSARPTLASYYRYMFGALAIGGAALVVSWMAHGHISVASAVLALAWSASPAIAVWASRTHSPRRARKLTVEDAKALRLIARRTWRYFETFVTPAHNWLPPDNFQQDPKAVVAHRTSPTNIGLYLLSALAAHDLGWAGLGDTLARLEATLATLNKLDRFRGHFYNWYDTHDLRALEPRYVSSVDSGNLAGHLIVVANACIEWGARPGKASCSALDVDALSIARAEAASLRAVRRMPTLPWEHVEQELAELEQKVYALAGDQAAPIEHLSELSRRAETIADTVEAHALDDDDDSSRDLVYWLRAASSSFAKRLNETLSPTDEALGQRLASLARAFRTMAVEMDFTFLLDRHRLLLSIGYRGADGVLDPSCYDLLASEARLASLFAIAKGDAPTKHWFRLGHAVTLLAQGPALISWSGSMFEYLMPALVMREPRHSLLERTNELIVQRQIEHGRDARTPWGVSESAYNARDLELNYQYSNFGVPGLGLKRGLADNLVISPYATALAAMVQPLAAVRNFRELAEMGALGRFGFYEAVDFTPERVQTGRRAEIVQSFMAHHQGMTISAIANVLCADVLRARFHAEPMIKAAELLLQERVPLDIQPPPASHGAERAARPIAERNSVPSPRSPSPWSASPSSHLLSNGRYSVMVTASGAGYSCWRGLALTRWREDATCDDWGAFLYIRDVERDVFWSPTLQPARRRAHAHRVSFDEGKAEFSCSGDGLSTALEILVSEEDDAEVRRLSIRNTGLGAREVEVTSFAELALTTPASDIAHPAFSKLFVEIEHLARTGALIARRRLRSADEPAMWAAHLAVVEGELVGQREFETDRGKFLGRGRDVGQPLAVLSGAPLSGSTGATLDPIFALRRRVRLGPGESARIHFWTVAASSRQEVIELIDKHNDSAAFARAQALAWTQAQIELHHLGVDRAAAGVYQRLAGHLLYANPAMRPGSDAIDAGRADQSRLWSMGVSGDLPILLVRLSEAHEIAIVEEALQAFEYLRTKRLAVDLVIVNERAASYQQDLQNAIEHAVHVAQARPHIGAETGGHIYVLRADLVAELQRAALASAARVVLRGDRGSLAEQLRRRPEAAHIGREAPRKRASGSALHTPGPAPDLDYFNGLGGFARTGDEYVITLAPGQTTPAPWINVIANAGFGFQVSEAGAGFVWSENSREHQITPWSNDPVRDSAGQAFYVRDRDSGEIFSPTAAPLHDEGASHTIRHGRGYSRFEHAARGLSLSLIEYVPLADPIKISRLVIVNTAQASRRLAIAAYVEWALGASRQSSAPHIVTERDQNGALFASNSWNGAFASRVAFADMGGRQQSWTGDRREFIGRNGSLSAPAALAADADLSGRLGAGLDPCAAMVTNIELAAGQSAEIVFLLGDAPSAETARALIERYRTADLDAVLDEVRAFWNDTLGAVQVKTPDHSFDLMMNGALLYQTLACRMWARSGFYQASGAYGFRDQLQDAMALVIAKPELARAHLLCAAAQQFQKGDVQHWWLPHSGQGVRTRISDDRLWLPFAVAHYLATTGDEAILDEHASFLEGPELKAGQAEAFFRPERSHETATLYEHCARALDASLAVGAHGAPLIGGGDWNDGFNRMGLEGRGESVWLGWFLCAALRDFLPIAEAKSDAARVARWRQHAQSLRAALEREAWDGEWYRRAWTDNGEAIGSAANEECRLDSIAQSWAVLSGAADGERARRAMAAVERDLVREQDGMALLFTPPFDKARLDPGYIKGYPPGVRENGGQYTHGAVWSIMALAALGEGDKAAALFWMLNPINHARTRTDAHRYRVEPYVMAADVYSAPGQVGRGGWTWYTGSAGLMYRAGLEYILGLRIEGHQLRIAPCIPKNWPGFSLTLRHGSISLEISVANPRGVSCGVERLLLDGRELAGPSVPLPQDGQAHRLEIVLGGGAPVAADQDRAPALA
jgi:cyclic beta-1,2-glucan synthetase